MWLYCIKLASMLTDFLSHGQEYCLVSSLLFGGCYDIRLISRTKNINAVSNLGGNLKGGINQAGIDYYNNLINELLSKGKNTLSVSHYFELRFRYKQCYSKLDISMCTFSNCDVLGHNFDSQYYAYPKSFF